MFYYKASDIFTDVLKNFVAEKRILSREEPLRS